MGKGQAKMGGRPLGRAFALADSVIPERMFMACEKIEYPVKIFRERQRRMF